MKNRNPWFVAILSLITLGIYEIYWLVSTKNEMNRRGAGIPSIWLIFTPLLGLIGVAILQIIAHFILSASSSSGSIFAVINFISVLVGILAVIGILPTSIYWYYKYASGVDAVTKKATTFRACFWWGMLAKAAGLDFIWAGVIQSRFNKQIAS